MSLFLVVVAMVLAASSGLPGLFLPRSSARGQFAAACVMGPGAFAGLVGCLVAMLFPDGSAAILPWPSIGDSVLRLDPLSAFFLVPVFLVGGLGSVYGLGYWPQDRYAGSARKLQLFWGTLVAGMSLLVISRNAMSFLLGWEVMALSAFFLVSLEHQREESRRAGWVYLIATHVGTLALFGLFSYWRNISGSFALDPIPAGIAGAGPMNLVFLLAFLAFGLKAGMMPLHFWLPGAHAASPSHVSAILSGVVLKMGIYGLVRILSLIPDPPAVWGGAILASGAASGILGVLFALGQHDLKRLLAYHSVENVGIILMGLGLAMLGRSLGRPEWTVLGMAGCLLHVWNHSIFKSLLFLGAGSVVRATHTRRMDLVGGLAKSMPWTAFSFLVGAVAICGLPPLNGFASELCIYLGALGSIASPGFRGPAAPGVAAVVVPALALIGALAVACFVKVYGTVFLGLPRTPMASGARESPLSMRIPMLVLASSCMLIGLAPSLFCPFLDRAIACWTTDPSLARLVTLVPFVPISLVSAGLLAFAGMLWLLVWTVAGKAAKALTWDCGYAAPSARMQYTASGFAASIVSFFAWVLRPRLHRSGSLGLFPAKAEMSTHVDDAVLDRVLAPASHAVERRFGQFRGFQRGETHVYILYIIITLIIMLWSMVPVRDLVARLFAL